MMAFLSTIGDSMKTPQEIVQKIKGQFPLYSPVTFKGEQYVVMAIDYFNPCDRRLQFGLVSIRLTNSEERNYFARFYIDLVAMEITESEISEYPAHLQRPLPLEENINSILKDEGMIY